MDKFLWAISGIQPPPPPPQRFNAGHMMAKWCRVFGACRPKSQLPPSPQSRHALEQRRGWGWAFGPDGGGGSEGGLTLLLDNFFWPILLVASGWLMLIPGALWMVIVNSWWSKDVQCTANSKQ